MKPGDEIRRRADAIEASAREQLARADELRRLADQADALAIGSESLTGAEKSTTLLTDVSASSLGISIARGNSRALREGHPFAMWLFNVRGSTMSEWAGKHKRRDHSGRSLAPSTVSSWVAKPGSASAKPIPRYWATKIAAESTDSNGHCHVPATAETWPNGIYDE